MSEVMALDDAVDPFVYTDKLLPGLGGDFDGFCVNLQGTSTCHDVLRPCVAGIRHE